jgi:hypothetical protein
MRVRTVFHAVVVFLAIALLPEHVSAQSSSPMIGEAKSALSLPAGADVFAVTMGAFEFAPASSDNTYARTTVAGGEMLMTACGACEFVTNLHLPSGVLLDHLELDYCDTTSDEHHMVMALSDCLDNVGGPGGCSQIGFAFSPDSPQGCGFADSDPLGATIDNTNHDYLLTVSFPLDTTNIGFRGAKVYYRLQVSPAPATATFNDVPSSDPAFQFIEAFAKAGITAGCSAAPPLYCPDAPLTRRQMAVFFAKALGLRWPG